MAKNIEDLYHSDILKLAEQVKHDARLPQPCHSLALTSPLCGSRLRLDLTLNHDQTIAAIGYQVRACALGQCSLALMRLVGVGASLEEIKLGKAYVEKLLSTNKDKNCYEETHMWEDYQILAPASEYPSRHGSILLPFLTIISLFGQIKSSSMDG